MRVNYYKYLKSEEWKELKKLLLEEAEYECERCEGKATELHHLNYDNLGHEILGVDVMAVCKNCHKEIHEEEGDYREYLGYNNYGYGTYKGY